MQIFRPLYWFGSDTKMVSMHGCRVTSSCLTKVTDFNLSCLHLMPSLWVIPFKFYWYLWLQKTGVH